MATQEQPSTARAVPAPAQEPGQWKLGNELLPFHPDASHIPPDYRDGWNDCYQAALRCAVPLGTTGDTNG